jgi:hypothetical protein
MRFLNIILIGVSFILSIVSFGLTSGVGIGFSNWDRIIYHDVSVLVTTLEMQNAANNMTEANYVNNNITIDVFALPALEKCEEDNREDIIPVIELAESRYLELMGFEVIFTYNLSAINASVYLAAESMNNTGLNTVYSSETASPWNYSVAGMSLNSEDSLYYISFDAFQIVENQTELLLGLNLTGTGFLPIYDDQTLKLANAPDFIRFTQRTFSASGLSLVTDGFINFLEILNKIEMSL